MWDNLSIKEKADVIKVAINNGVLGLPEIKESYNSFAGGGDFDSDNVLDRANRVYTNYDEAKDFDMNSTVYNIRKSMYDKGIPHSGLSNCTLTATQWIDPHNPIKSAKTIVTKPSDNGYYRINQEDIIPGDLMISENPKNGSYHTMLVESINKDGSPNLRYSTGGPGNDSMRYGVSQKEYHKRDNSQGGNHTEDMFYRYKRPNEIWLPEITVTPNKKALGGNLFDIGGNTGNNDVAYIHTDEDGKYYVNSTNNGRIYVTPTDTSHHNPAKWTYKDEYGREYTPHDFSENREVEQTDPDQKLRGIRDITPEAYHSPWTTEVSDWFMRQMITPPQGWPEDKTSPIYHGGLAQRTFLTTKKDQRDAILNSGLYIEGTQGDYGLVTKAVGDRNIPVYQRAKDDAKREDLLVIGNLNNAWYGNPNSDLIHANNHPTALYFNPYNNNIYHKAWDLNDYGGAGGSTAGLAGLIADAIGNPIVQTTGFSKVPEPMEEYLHPENPKIASDVYDVYSENTLGDMLIQFYKEKGLNLMSIPEKEGYKIVPMLPEVTVTGNKKAEGGNLFKGGGGTNNASRAMSYLMGKGISKTGAAAIVGTLQAESGLIPSIHAKTPGDTGVGLAQWTGGRRDIFWKVLEKLEPGAKKKYGNIDRVPFEKQLDVVLAERPDVMRAISNAKDLHTATDIMLRGYENGGGNAKNLASIAQMNKIYGKWNNGYNKQMTKRVGNAGKLLGMNIDTSMYSATPVASANSNVLIPQEQQIDVPQIEIPDIVENDPTLAYSGAPIIINMTQPTAPTIPEPVYTPQQERIDNINRLGAALSIMGVDSPMTNIASNNPLMAMANLSANGGNLFDKGGQKTIWKDEKGYYTLDDDKHRVDVERYGDHGNEGDASTWEFSDTNGKVYSPHGTNYGMPMPLMPEKGLEIVSPEFDLLTLGPLVKGAAKYGIERAAKMAASTNAANPTEQQSLSSIWNYIRNGNPITEKDVNKALIEAAKYKNSEGYANLINKARQESVNLGIGDFPEETFFTGIKGNPTIRFEERPPKIVGGYDYDSNTISLDPKKLGDAIETPFHEALHKERVGKSNLYIGPNFEAWNEAYDSGNPIEDKLWKVYKASTNETERRTLLKNAEKYLQFKVDQALYPDANPYLRIPSELVVNGLEAGKAIGVKPFAEYPGPLKTFEYYDKAVKYNPYLKGVKAEDEQTVKNFWDILTGNYHPAAIPTTIGVGTAATLYNNNNEQ